MKVIVNSLHFYVQLEQAFNEDCHVIRFNGNEGRITFGTTKYQSDVYFNCERQYGVSDTVRFNNLGMAKLLLFLKQLKEQPVLLTIEDETIRIESVIDFI